MRQGRSQSMVPMGLKVELEDRYVIATGKRSTDQDTLQEPGIGGQIEGDRERCKRRMRMGSGAERRGWSRKA